VTGIFLDSLSSAMQLMLDPNEFLILQSSLFASFAKVNPFILILSVVLCAIGLLSILDHTKKLDVLSLGHDHAINLGVDYRITVRKLLILVCVLVSISTALVGPITFLGLLSVNIAKEILKTYKHSYLILGTILISVFSLFTGQIIAEKIFANTISVSIIINFIGGIYLLSLFLKERKTL
ncbi:MAG: iron chelate uptake ABC transporter family permease subunit, partial [Oscillospiraceae bacterium]